MVRKALLSVGDAVRRSLWMHTPEDEFRDYASPMSEQLQSLREEVAAGNELVPGSDVIMDWLLGDVTRGMVEHFRSCESPIERMFLSALLLNTQGWTISLMDDTHSDCPLPEKDPSYLVIEIQKKLSRYRVDFLLRARECNGPWVEVVVECDGHDYHERTKEQAAKDRSRDRKLQALGYPVLRYTGSELWADSFRCADEALQFLGELAFKALGSQGPAAR